MDPISPGNSPPVDPSLAEPEPAPAHERATSVLHDTIEAYVAHGQDATSHAPEPRSDIDAVRDHARHEVELCKRDADLPLGHTLHLKHHWIRTATKEAGMGRDDGSVPGKHIDIPYVTKTTVNDHTGEGAQADAECTEVPNVDAGCVNRELELGKKLGRWTPTNQCQTFAADVLARCSTKKE